MSQTIIHFIAGESKQATHERAMEQWRIVNARPAATVRTPSTRASKHLQAIRAAQARAPIRLQKGVAHDRTSF